ncbi:MAG: cell division protein FtsX [Candidatus Paceibacteria bacterium]
MIVSIRRVIKAGFVAFWRNAYVSMASVFVITIALFVIASTMLIDQLLTSSLQQLQAKVDVNVYFVPTAPESEIERIQTALLAMPEVAEVIYTSREEALALYRERNQNNTVVLQSLDELGENPLGASLAVRALDTTYYESIANFLNEEKAKATPQTQIIDDFNYERNRVAIERLSGIIDAVERGSLITMAVLIIAAIMITFNTIRLAIYTAREEISVMRLVGASNMFIRGPFLLQGIMYGFVATVLALLILYPIVIWISPGTIAFFQFDLFAYFVSNFSYIFLTLIGIGVLLGLLSSALAIRRYLNI